MSEEIAKDIEGNYEPVDKLQKLNQILNQHSTYIWSILSQDQTGNLKREFYSKVFKNIAEKMLKERVLSKPSILRFFRNILVNFFPQDVQEESIAEVVHLIFNLDASLYTSAIQTASIKKNINVGVEQYDEDMSLEQKRVLSEMEWRKQLKVGDKIDIVKMKPNQHHRISGWNRGEIKSINEDDNNLLSVVYDNDNEQSQRLVNRFNPEIAPLNTFTDDFDWRYELKPGDEIDCLDSESVWYRSTVMDQKVDKSGDKEIKEIYVAYRVYEEEGHKVDDDGRKYTGWSNKYDHWESVTCPIVQKLNTVCKHYIIAGRNTMIYDNVIDDMNDVLYNTKERKIWTVYRSNFFANLKCIPDYLNEFGMRRGFENILLFMNEQQSESKVTLKHLFYLMDFLAKTLPLWHKQFSVYYIPLVKDAFIKCILLTNQQMTGPLQQKFNRENLTQIQKAFQNILRRYYTSDHHCAIMGELQFQLGFSLLNSKKLEQRIQGFKEIIEQIKTSRFSNMKRTMNPKEITYKLKQENVFEQIFGQNYHIQLIQRSGELIKFLAQEKELGQQEIDYIWSVTKKDQQTKMEIYKIISDIALNFRPEEIDMLVEKFASVPPDEFVEKEIECVFELSKYSSQKASHQQKAVSLFWEIATQVRPYRKQIVDIAIEKFLELMRNHDREQKGEYILKCLVNIEAHKSTLQSIKIMYKLLDSIPSYVIGNNMTQYDLTNQLIDQYHLLDLVINDIQIYCQMANELWEKGILNENNIENYEMQNLQYSHRSHLQLRLNFLRQVLQMSKRQLEQDHLERVWDILMEQSKIAVDSDIFFDWLKPILHDNNKLSGDLLHHFFQTKVSSVKVNFKNIKKAGFDCICSLFLQINELKDNLIVISHYGGLSGSKDSKLDFKIHVEPINLEGIEVIWKLFQDCEKKNAELTSLIIDLLTKIYHNLSSLISSEVHKIEDQFTQEALKRLQMVVEDSNICNEGKKQMCYITLHMMKSFFEDSEKNGTGGLRPHQAIERGDYLEKIVIQNNITSQKACPKMIVISTYSNMTIWELKKIIARKTKTSPLKIQLNRSDVKKTSINDTHNARLLRELQIESYEVITAQKKPLVYTTRSPLVNRQQQLMPEARKIFESWFDKFSKDGYMTPETCVDFIKSSTQDSAVNALDQRVQRLFQEYDTDKDNKLSKEEFLEFYRERASIKPEPVWQNLQAHHYGNDLKPINYNPYQDDDPNEITDKTLLPRYKLSSNQETFELLFSIIAKLQNSGQDELWQLITCLTTNPTAYINLLKQQGLDEICHPHTSVYKQLYYLQIIQSFINEHSIKQDCVIQSYYVDQQEEYVQAYPSLDSNSNDKQNEEKQSSAPKSGVAIPLPDANTQVITNKSGGYVPEPPSGMIGPQLPPANNNQDKEKVMEQLQNFKGQVVNELINYDIFTNEDLKISNDQDIPQDHEQMRRQWLQTFINIGGFKILLQLLTILNMHHQDKKPEEILKQKVEKECLNQTLKLMKIILISAFSANASSSDLIIQLARKMSQKDIDDQKDENKEESKEEVKDEQKGEQKEEEKKSKDVKKNIKQEQEDLAKQYQPLIQILTGNLGNSILESLDFNLFQEQILTIIQLVLKKKSIFQEDRLIIEQGLSLWISCILYNHELLQRIYDEPDQDIETGKTKNKICSILIEDGLICENYTVRESFKRALLFICDGVKSQTLTELPVFYFLKLLINELDLLEYKSRQSKQYFQLTEELLIRYFDYLNKFPYAFTKIFETSELLQLFMHKLHIYESKEQKRSILEDTNLVGYLSMINQLIKNDPSALTEQHYETLMTETVERCLFTFKMNPLEIDITKDVDLQQYEKTQLNKCQTNDSRETAYNLLQTICKVQPKLIEQIISKYWCPLLFKVKKPKRAGYAPRTEGRSHLGYCGLKNLGCTCYMNSMIQQFFHIPTFRYSLMATDDNQAPNWVDFEGEVVDDNMLHQFIKLMAFLELSERQDYNPREFCFAFKDFQGNPTNVRIQQDAQEFLNVAFDRIDNLLAKTSQKYLLQNIFGGKTCSLMICKSCGNLRKKFEDFYNLSLEVKNQNTIYESLNKYISGELINDFQCQSCNKKVDVERKTVLEKLPNVLIVHLQRIVFDFDSLQNQKLNSRVEFPNVLNLKPYMLSEIMKKEKELLKQQKQQKKENVQDKINNQQQQYQAEDQKDESCDNDQENQEQQPRESPQKQSSEMEKSFSQDSEMEEEEQIKDEDENYEYKLVGVVVHMGTADAGHYISYINISRDDKSEESNEWLKTENEKWVEFNDSQVKDYRFKNLEEDCFGGAQSSMSLSNDYKNDYSRNAYMLIYEKRRKELIKTLIPNQFNEQMTSSSLDCDGTAISRVNNTNLNFDIATPYCPQLAQKLKAGEIKQDEENKEYYTLVDFKSVEKFVPNPLYKNVHEDNTVFLSEKHIFSNNFFKCTQQMLELITSENSVYLSSEQESQNLFAFMDRLIFDLLSMTSENKQLSAMTTVFINMLSKNDQQTLNLIQNRILKHIEQDKDKNNKDEKNFFDLLLSNMDKDVREMAQQILTFAVNRMFELQNIEIVDKIMNIIFGLIPEEASKNWLKIPQLLTFLFNVTKSGKAQLYYMVQRKLITKLIDFFLENESPLALGQRRHNMGSNYANAPFEILILNVSYIARNMPYIPVIQPDNKFIIEPDKVSPYFLKLYDDFNVILSVDDINMLQLKQFYNKAMKFGYECIELGRLAGHVSFENYEIAQKIAKKILIGINKANGDDVLPYLNVLCPYLTFTDSLKQCRLEWILGIPQLKTERPAIYNMQSNSSNLKFGVQIVSSMNDDVFDYKSTLFKTSHTIKEALLQIFYQYRKRWTKYSLLIASSLFTTAKYETQGEVFKYMQMIDPPTYSYSRYIDWIKPYLKEQIESCEKNYHIQSYRDEMMMGLSILSLYDQLEEQYGDIQVQDQPAQVEQNQQKHQEHIIQHDLNKGGPEPYLIWNIIEERIIDTRDYPEDMIQVQVREFNVSISQSAPTGQRNLVIPQQIFQSQFSNNNTNNIRGNQSNQKANIHRKPQFGRGERQQKSQNKCYNSSASKNKLRRTQQRQNQGGNPQNYYQSDDQQTQLTLSPQDADCDAELKDDYEREEEIESSEEEQSKAQNNQDQDGVNDVNDIQVYDQDHFQQDDQQEPQQQRKQGIVPQMDNQQDVEIEAKQVDNDEFWNATSWAVILFSITNFDSNKAQKVTLRFIDKSQNENPINFLIPSSPIPCQVLSKREKELIIFSKLRSFDESWGNFDYHVKVEQPNGIKFNIQGASNSPQRDPQIFPDERLQSGDPGNQQFQNQFQDDIMMKKTCQACTYDNDASRFDCEICGTPLSA